MIAGDLSVPYSQEYQRNAVEGLEAAGVKVIEGAHGYDPGQAARLMEQCVARHADVIVSPALSSDLLAEPIKAVKAAGIPYVEAFIDDPGPLKPEVEARGVVAGIHTCTACAGRTLSDWVAVDSGGDAHAVAIWDAATPIGVYEHTAMRKELATVCPECTFDLKSVPRPPDWPQRLPTLTASIIKDPEVSYLMPVYSDMGTLMAPSVASAGAQDRVKIASYNTNKPSLKMIRDGGPVAANVGELPAWIGWAVADQLLRVLAGEEPLDDNKVPQRLFDATNVDSVDVDGDPERWFGVDFQAGYKALWGLQ